ncbi:MAG: glycosyltransferase [Alphaproteobacteria bacterium]|nr:glycosyltransferase [Alphaproteobacteria bacterium]
MDQPLTVIPKTIHYCWFGPNPVYPLGVRCVESWKRYMPDWNYVFWTEDTLPRDLKMPWRFIERRQFAFASDYVRLHAIAAQGGLYLDIDAEAIRPLDPLLAYRQFLCYEREGRATNGICGGVAGASFFTACLKTMEEHYAKSDEPIIAPDMCMKVLQSGSFPDLTILPPHTFYPYNPYDATQPVKQLMFADIKPDTLIIHHWAKGWKLSLWQRIKRFIKERFL